MSSVSESTPAAPGSTVHVLTIEHRHGLNVSAHSTKDLAYAALLRYVEEWWEQELSDEMPSDRDAAIDAYFENVEETWEIHELIVE